MVVHGMISIKPMKKSKKELVEVKYYFNLDNK
jgi:hypothetical protein